MSYVAHVRDKEITQPLKDHLLAVGKISSELAAKIGMPYTGELLGLLHDIGKYSSTFQNYLKSATGLIDSDADGFVDAEGLKGKIDHSTAGAQVIWEELGKQGGKKAAVAQILALCLASHHSGLIDCITPDGENKFLERINKSIELTNLHEVKEKLDNDINEKIKYLINTVEPEVSSYIQNLLNSNKKNSVITYFQLTLFVRMLFSCLIDADRLDTANFENPQQANIRLYGKYIDWSILIDRFENKLSEIQNRTSANEKTSRVNEIRKLVADECLKKSDNPQGIYTLTVPTGGGKTLSSLRFALHHAKKHELDRIIYVIPYTSIIEQNAQVAREFLENETDKGKIVLEYHSNLLPKNYTWRNKTLAENWDAPIIFTTTVQFLETLFASGTQSARRMHQLAKSVIIFDEIQTIPVKTVHLFNNAINFLVKHCKSTVLLCTATQPLLNEVNKELGALEFDGEIITDVKNLFYNLKRVNIENKCKPNGWEYEKIADFAYELVEKYKSCLIVVNTKKTAKQIFESLNRPNIPVYHLSTSMCPEHRNTKFAEIKNLLSKQQPVICVSTQLIEAGVDIDFGVVIRSLAGIDSIAQAAGRCNRNGTRDIAPVYIINPLDEHIDSLYDIKIGKEKTERILREIETNSLPNDLLDPQVIKRYFQYYFYDRSNEMVYKINTQREDSLLNMLSENKFAIGEYCRKYGNNVQGLFLRQSFQSAFEAFEAIDSPTIGIVVPYKEGENIISELFSQYAFEKRGELLRKAQRFTVSVFPNVFDKLIKENAIKEVPEIGVYTLCDKRYYHHDFGLTTSISTNYETLIN